MDVLPAFPSRKPEDRFSRHTPQLLISKLAKIHLLGNSWLTNSEARNNFGLFYNLKNLEILFYRGGLIVSIFVYHSNYQTHVLCIFNVCLKNDIANISTVLYFSKSFQ